MIVKFKVLCVVLLIFSLETVAQDNNDSIFSAQYIKAKSFIDARQFDNANEAFKSALALKTVLPNELAYYYGYTLIQINKFSSGKNLLTKYLTLTGDTGAFKGYALELIHLADCKEAGSYFVQETCNECHGSGNSIIDCRLCHGKGKQICNYCGGMGAIRRRTNFGESFSSCSRCLGLGEIDCTQCLGKGVEEAKCFACNGRGKIRVKKECDSLLLNLPK